MKMSSVANSIKVLQAFIYKSINSGLFFKSFVATMLSNVVKFDVFMIVFTFEVHSTLA